VPVFRGIFTLFIDSANDVSPIAFHAGIIECNLSSKRIMRLVGRLQAKEEATESERRGMKMALTRDFREARVKRDAAFRKGLLSEGIESLLSGEVTLGKELLGDYINATVGFPKLATHTKIHVKTLHQMFGPSGNRTANNLFEIVAYLQHAEGVRFKVRSTRPA
jgi:hypothetical protein